jgi:phosphonate degradation associated HDIG domain protein
MLAMHMVEMVVDEILNLYRIYGEEDYIGEPVSQLEHMCQMAFLAEAEGYDEEVILAAFLHDIGHLVASTGTYASMQGFGAMDHEDLGAYYLESKGFSSRLIRLVQSHVDAKRYLAHREPAYRERLSPASIKTLQFQGGAMTEKEAIVFEQDSLASLKIRFRRWDDEAKVRGGAMIGLDRMEPMLTRHLNNQFQVK